MTVFEWPRWLKLKHAAAYSCIGEKRLVELADSGEVKGFQDPDSGRGDWIFDRYTLDKYREVQAMKCGDVGKKASDILKSLGQNKRRKA